MENYLPLIGTIPFLILFLGLTITRIKSFVIGFTALAAAAIGAHYAWDADISLISRSMIEGALIAFLPIIWVIFAAVFTYFLSVKTGAIETIKKFLMQITPDKNIQAVLIAFCFGGFLESVAGFGTAVAIPTAMLISIGFNPVRSAIIALVANSVPVAFGALGIPVIVLHQITGLDLTLLTKYVAYQLLPFAFLIPAALVLIASPSFSDAKKALPDALLIGVLFTVLQTLFALFVGPELVAVSGSLFSLAIYAALKSRSAKKKSRTNFSELGAAVSNYIFLLVLVLITRLIDIPALKSFPLAVSINWGLHPVLFDYINTPGTLLFISALLGGFIQKARIIDFFTVAKQSASTIKYSALTIISIVALAKVMGNTAMIASVAGAMAALSGKAYPFFAPLIGAAGTFVTGSDTSSNILLGELQKQTALNAHLPAEWIVASNTSGATAGKMISPQSIAVAASTVGIENEESRILRGTILYCLGYVILLGGYVFIVSNIL